jgi:two-component system sensor kinase FixL
MNWALPKAKNAANRYAQAAALCVGALILRFAFNPILGNQLPFWTFWIAAAVAVWRLGLGPAIFVSILGLVLGDYFFINPKYTSILNPPLDMALILIYLVVSAIVCTLGGLMRVACRQCQTETQAALRQKERVEQEVSERQHREAVLRGIFEIAPVGIWILDKEGYVVGSNAAGAKIWDVPRDRSQNVCDRKGWWTNSGKMIQPHEWPYARAVLHGESSFDEEVEIETFDGERKCILISSVPLRDDSGKVTGAVAVNIDITQRKEAEKELSHQKLRIGLLHEAAAQLLSPVRSDEDIATLYRRVGAFFDADIFLEYATTDQTSATRELVVSGGIPADAEARLKHLQFAQAFCSTIPERREPVHADFVHQSQEPCLELIKGLGVHTYSVHPLLVGDRLLGTLAFASRHRDSFGREDMEFFQTLAHYVGIARDRERLTRSLQTYAHDLEAAVQERTARLEESSERLRVTVETAIDGIIAIDEYGKIEMANPAAERMFGYSRQEMLKNNVSMLMPEPDHRRHNIYLETYRLTGKRTILGTGREVVGRRKDGSVFPLHLGVSESRIGKRRFFTGFLRDITEQKRAERRIRRARDELEQLSYSIIHDMRAPLRAMHSFSQILQEENAHFLDAQANDYLRRIIESAERMDQLITDAFNYTTVLREEMPISPVRPERLLNSIVESYPQFRPERANIELAPEFPPVMANRAGLTQCFSNLLTNAVKFAQPGRKPVIRVWGERRQDMVRLCVQDEGVGIASQHQNRIFHMFQKLDTESTGTGIGLALVRKVVEKMHGTIGVESEPGRGARFWIDLPPAPCTR